MAVGMLAYHYNIDLTGVVYRGINANKDRSDPYFKDAYLWLEKQLGFYPLFLAVGTSDEDIRMTGYQNNWRVKISTRYEDGKPKGEYRNKGEFPNYALFSFKDVAGIFMDYDNWHLVLNASYKDYKMTEYEKRLIFKPSWSKSRWIRKAIKDKHSVQLVTKSLYLPDAKRIWVRNKETKTKLEDIGFVNVDINRIALE